MIPDDRAIRDAAILVAALDVAAADALLEGMDPAAAARVRACVMQLDEDEVDTEEERAVIERFLGRGQDKGEADSPGAVLDLDAAVRLEDFLRGKHESTAADERIVLKHKSVLPEALCGVLRHEHPQAIAVVLAHVAPELAKGVLERLSPKQQAEVARRIIHLQPVDQETLRVLEAGLEELIGSQLVHHGSQTGLAVMRNILSAAAGERRAAIAANMHRHDAALIGETSLGAPPPGAYGATPGLGQPPVEMRPANAQPAAASTAMDFEDFIHLDDADLGRVLHKAGGRLLLLALAGASDALMERVYAQLPRREAELLRRQIEQQGPISLRDVEAAQRCLAQLASAMADEGTIRAIRYQLSALG